MTSTEWSKREKEIARNAYQAAYERECEAILHKVRTMAGEATDPEGLWRIHDYLTEKRKHTDEKYDYRYSVLVFVFARLIREGWIKEEDIAGLSEEKLHEVRQILGIGGGG